MAGPFQEVAFNTPVGATSAPFKSTYFFNSPSIRDLIVAHTVSNLLFLNNAGMDITLSYVKEGKIDEIIPRMGKGKGKGSSKDLKFYKKISYLYMDVLIISYVWHQCTG